MKRNLFIISGGNHTRTLAAHLGAIGSVLMLPLLTGPGWAADGPCTPPPAGLVGWWSAEGNADDATGWNNGTPQGAATYGPGEVGLAFSFDPSNGTIIVPDSSSLRLTNQLTIEAWINTRSTNTDRAIVSKIGGVYGNNGYQLALSGNQLLGQFNSPGLGWPSSRIECALPIGLGTWYHVAWTYDQSAMKLYWNGRPVATNVIGPKTISATGSTLRISGDDNNHVYFDGLIDEPAVYNRALSDAEIAAIYNAGSAGKCGLPPGILVQPQSRTVAAGGSALFAVTASGSPLLNYSWQFDSTPIPGATASSLLLTNLQAEQAGSYSVIVTNLFGSVTSSLATLTITSAPPCGGIPAGLVSWWPGEGAANDIVSGNDGTLQGGAAFTPGIVGLAFSFDPANGTVIVPDASNLRLTNQLTIEAWINTRSTTTYRSIVAKIGGVGGNNGYQFDLAGSSFEGLFNSPGQGWPSSRITSPPLITTGVWYHVAWTYDQSAMKLYLNGQPVLTNVIGAKPIAASSSNLHISGDDNNHVYFDGQIDEPAVYNRALSAAEIAAIYNAGSAGICGPAPAIATPPQNQTVECGSNVSVSVTVTGILPLAYQWYFGSTAISGATNSGLVLTDVGFAQAGDYSVIVTNAYGSAQCGLTVTVLGAQGVKSNVLAQMTALRAVPTVTQPFTQKLDVAIGHLATSLTPACWIDQTHLQPKSGDAAMNEEKLAVVVLEGILHTTACPVSPDLLQGFIERIVKCDRLLAVTAVAEAAQAGQDGKKLDVARAEISKGDTEANAGHFSNAIEHYRNAWRHASQLSLQILVTPDGQTRLQFSGESGKSYRLEVSTDLVRWLPLETRTADAEGNVEFSDPNGHNQPCRFYRAVAQ